MVSVGGILSVFDIAFTVYAIREAAANNLKSLVEKFGAEWAQVMFTFSKVCFIAMYSISRSVFLDYRKNCYQPPECLLFRPSRQELIRERDPVTANYKC